MGWDEVQQASCFFSFSSSLQSSPIAAFYKHQLIGCIGIVWSCFHFTLHIYLTTFIESHCYYSYYSKTLLSPFLFTFCHSPFESQLFLLHFSFQLLILHLSLYTNTSNIIGVPPIFLMHSHNFTKDHITFIVAQLDPFINLVNCTPFYPIPSYSIPSCSRSILSVYPPAGGTLRHSFINEM